MSNCCACREALEDARKALTVARGLLADAVAGVFGWLHNAEVYIAAHPAPEVAKHVCTELCMGELCVGEPPKDKQA